MKLNLSSPLAETREQRLGTTVAWDGKASELWKASQGEGCGRCKLCETERRGPFTQGATCSEMMAECQAGHVRGAVLIQHSPVGCAASQVDYNSKFRNSLKIRHLPVENMHAISTNLTENDMVFGGLAKLEQTIRDAWKRYSPQAIFIGTSCSTAIIGDDIDSVAEKHTKELGIPVIPLHCEGFKSKHWSTGFDVTQHGILRQIVDRNPKKEEDLVNVVNLWGSDVFTPMLAKLGLRVNYVVDLATVDDLRRLSSAAATVSFCYTLSSCLATVLEQEFGVPQIKAPQPYGFAGMDAWIRELARVTHREKKAETYIKNEHERVRPQVEALKKKLCGVKGFAATGSAYLHGLITVMRELGITVDGSLVFHHDPVYDSGDPRQDSLGFLVRNYGDVPSFSVSNRQQYQFYGLLKRVNPDFILIRHNGLAPLASRLGIPAAPLGDEHLAVGYQGMINLGEIILDILAHKRFHQDLAAHVKLPYSKWWLAQDPYALVKNPPVQGAE